MCEWGYTPIRFRGLILYSLTTLRHYIRFRAVYRPEGFKLYITVTARHVGATVKTQGIGPSLLLQSGEYLV